MAKQILSAKFRGTFLPEKFWEGGVQSIYSKAINLLHPSGYLISIVNNQNQMSDYGLVVVDFKLMLARVSSGSQFQWKDDHIIFPEIIVDISEASLWSGFLVSNLVELPINIKPILIAFIKFAKEEGLSPLITKKNGNIYSTAAEEIIDTASGSADVSIFDLSKLVGLGIGFTPSGDDFLTGVMLYETMSGVKIINRKSIRDKLSGTTDGGRTLLSLALRNSFPFYLKQFAESIWNRESLLDEIVNKALMHGSTSGSDSLTGFLWASEKIEKLEP